MRHVDHEPGVDRVGDGAQGGEIEPAGIGRTTGDDHARPTVMRQRAHGVEIDAFGFAVHAIGDNTVVASGQRRRMAMADVTARRDIHRQDCIAKAEQSEKYAGVGVRAGMRLDIDEPAPEQTTRAVDRH